MERFSRKAEKDRRSQEIKVKKALQAGNVEGARIYAENAIRKKNESLNYLRMGARIDAVSARVQSAMAMKSVTHSIAGVTKALGVWFGRKCVSKNGDIRVLQNLQCRVWI